MDSAIISAAKSALIKLLLLADKRTAIKLLDGLEVELKNDLDILIHSLNILTNEELKSSFHNVMLPTLEITSELISKDGVNYNLSKTITNLYNQLRCFWLFDSQSIALVKDQLSTLAEGSAKGIQSSIFHLAELWYKNREKEITEEAKIVALKHCISELYNNSKKEDLLFTHHSLFSGGSNDDYFISKDIHQIFFEIFDFASENLSEKGIVEIISYWFSIEEEKYAYDNHKIAIAFAQAISEYKPRLVQQILKLIEYAERIVRYEEETAPLLDNLGEISIAYGRYDFTEQFERIYNELFEISFGLHYKKDYQAKYITDSLEELQIVAPNRILNELVEVYHAQKQISQVGRGRMTHICMSYLIAFTIKHYPKLAFEIIKKEENRSISREEALSIILPPVIEKSNAKELLLYLSIVKTINTPDARIDSYFIPLLEKSLERSLQLKEDKLINQIIDIIKYHISVELDDIEIYNAFSLVLLNNNLNPIDFGLPEYKENNNKKESIDRKEKFSIHIEPLLANEAIEMIEKDYNHFKEVLEIGFDKCSKNRIISTSRNEYYRSKSIVERFFKERKVKATNNKAIFTRIIKYFLKFAFELSNLSSQRVIQTSEFKILLTAHFIDRVDSLLQTIEFSEFIRNEVDLEDWINEYLKFINDHRFFINSAFLPKNEIQKIVGNTSLIYVDELLDFIEKYTDDKAKITSLLKLSSRLLALNKTKAISILNSLVENNFHNVYFNEVNINDIGFDIFEMLIKYDKSYGKKALMNSFYNRNGRYSYEIISKVHELLKYKQYYENETTIVEILYTSNLQYNKELGKGLPEKKKEFNFIASHKEDLGLEDIIIKYLVSLFDYPVVYVKQLSLQSLFDLLETEDYLKNLFHWGIIKGTANQIEYTLILIHAIVLRNPKAVYPFKDELLELSKYKHFSILEQVKSIFDLLLSTNENLLSVDEKILLSLLNIPSFINTESQFSDLKEGEHFIYSKYQADILTVLYHNDYDKTLPIHKILYAELSKKGFGLDDYTLEDESDIHKLLICLA